jgi:hypothetical protein
VSAEKLAEHRVCAWAWDRADKIGHASLIGFIYGALRASIDNFLASIIVLAGLYCLGLVIWIFLVDAITGWRTARRQKAEAIENRIRNIEAALNCNVRDGQPSAPLCLLIDRNIEQTKNLQGRVGAIEARFAALGEVYSDLPTLLRFHYDATEKIYRLSSIIREFEQLRGLGGDVIEITSRADGQQWVRALDVVPHGSPGVQKRLGRAVV